MHKAKWLLAALLALGLASCRDTTAPRAIAIAAPRGLYSTTGDASVTLRWLANTESGIAGYRVYESTCPTACPYDRVGTTTATSFVVAGLANGVSRFFAVAAVDGQGNESPLSYETVGDTPRPAGSGGMVSYHPDSASGTGWDFAAHLARPWMSNLIDIYFYGDNTGRRYIYTADNVTDIQDLGYATTLDAVDFAPPAGWSPTRTVEAILDHNYVVWTRYDRYAKFRITAMNTNVGPGTVSFDWAYQPDSANGELRARRAGPVVANGRRAYWTQR